jgi:pentatricopeptide repeat protein
MKRRLPMQKHDVSMKSLRSSAMKEIRFMLLLLAIFPAAAPFSPSKETCRLCRTDFHGSQQIFPLPVSSTFSASLLLSRFDGEVGDSSSPSSTSANNGFLMSSMQQKRRNVMSRLRQNDHRGALKGIEGMIDSLHDIADKINGDCKDREALCEVVDNALQPYYSHAFATPFQGRSARRRILMGMEAVQLQLSSGTLEAPYNTIPKRTLLSALKALTGLNKVKQNDIFDVSYNLTDVAYRILQRLVTGVGIRHFNPERMTIHESDFNMVLNAYSNVGRMDMAHRIVALQERTAHAPPLSPVAYSILLKGYGRLADLDNVEMILAHAEVSGVQPDTVMLNSLIDAYVNCNEVDKARAVFYIMKDPVGGADNKFVSEHRSLFSTGQCPRPNNRTYNTVLKGLANIGALEESISLSEEMEHKRMWDAVTTNTLVQAAVSSRDFSLAENILDKYTVNKDPRSSRHPNVEAYTNLLDGYAKAGELEKALGTLQLMKKRGVEPNEVTYTCIIGALARNDKLEQALKMMSFMTSTGIRPTAVTYNAFISGLLAEDYVRDQSRQFDKVVDLAIKLLRQMMLEGTRPNAVTISVIVGAFGRCDRPRVVEAKSLVAKLVKDGIVSANNNKVVTALVQVCGVGEDLEGALEAFRGLQKPDVAAINSFLDACCRCSKELLAMETFANYFQKGTVYGIEPDVISYSILISAQLKKNSIDGASRARKLYEEMRNGRGVMVDNALVDIILKELIRNGRNSGLQKKDARFLAGVLRDADRLYWDEGQLERRKRAVQTVVAASRADVWGDDADLRELVATEEEEDDFLKRHGWNSVDSGFQLWGGGKSMAERKEIQESDEFLRSKGWNNVDSGFRII